jgi:hypothetical protein
VGVIGGSHDPRLWEILHIFDPTDLQNVSFKEFHAALSFICSIAISFTLSAATTNQADAATRHEEAKREQVGKRVQMLYGVASVLLVSALTISITYSLVITIPNVKRYLVLAELDTAANYDPERDPPPWRNRVVAGALLTIGIALLEGVNRGVGIAFITAVALIAVICIFAHIVYNMADRPKIPPLSGSSGRLSTPSSGGACSV